MSRGKNSRIIPIDGSIPMFDMKKDNNNNSNKVYGYVRVSTQTQEDGMGKEVQVAGIEKYCKDNGYELVEIFEETVSGVTEDEDDLKKREKLLQMISQIALSLDDVTKIVVYNTSRLWRNEVSSFVIRQKMKKLEAEIISVQQPNFTLYPNNASEKIFLGMAQLFDSYERDSIVEKLATGRTAKAKTGNKPSGLTPYGYAYSYDRKTVVKDPEESLVVEEIFTLYRKGFRCASIASILNRNGYKTRIGNRWTRQSLWYLVTNDFYAGILTHKSHKTLGKQPTYIGYEEWLKLMGKDTETLRVSAGSN